MTPRACGRVAEKPRICRDAATSRLAQSRTANAMAMKAAPTSAAAPAKKIQAAAVAPPLAEIAAPESVKAADPNNPSALAMWISSR